MMFITGTSGGERCHSGSDVSLKPLILDIQATPLFSVRFFQAIILFLTPLPTRETPIYNGRQKVALPQPLQQKVGKLNPVQEKRKHRFIDANSMKLWNFLEC